MPRCLLADHAPCQDNTQPDVVIVEEFYDKYPKFACAYEAKCEHSESCLGLHHPYISKFGWEEDRLRPYPRTTPWAEPEYGPRVGSDRPGQDPAPTVEPSRWAALVEGVAQRHGAQLQEVTVQRRACVFRFRLEASGSPAEVDVVLEARDEAKPALVRSRSFNLYYRNARGPQAPLSALVQDAVRTVVARDPGGMPLDRRKGLVGPQSRRRRPRAAGASEPEVSDR